VNPDIAIKRNLANQLAVYEEANGTRTSVTVIICYTAVDQLKVERVLRELGLSAEQAIVAVDARSDNKPSASTV
jgi:hypothetical protein